jgi:hypothetical protein
LIVERSPAVNPYVIARLDRATQATAKFHDCGLDPPGEPGMTTYRNSFSTYPAMPIDS